MVRFRLLLRFDNSFTGSEAFDPIRAYVEPGTVGVLEAFEITIDGNTFVATDDPLYPEYPQVAFEDGELLGMNFDTEPPPYPALDIILDHPSVGSLDWAKYWNSNGQIFEGVVCNIRKAPEPATLALTGRGLAGIGYKRHRSIKVAKQEL